MDSHRIIKNALLSHPDFNTLPPDLQTHCINFIIKKYNKKYKVYNLFFTLSMPIVGIIIAIVAFNNSTFVNQNIILQTIILITAIVLYVLMMLFIHKLFRPKLSKNDFEELYTSFTKEIKI
jgi:hypothetical protein